MRQRRQKQLRSWRRQGALQQKLKLRPRKRLGKERQLRPGPRRRQRRRPKPEQPPSGPLASAQPRKHVLRLNVPSGNASRLRQGRRPKPVPPRLSPENSCRLCRPSRRVTKMASWAIRLRIFSMARPRKKGQRNDPSRRSPSASVAGLYADGATTGAGTTVRSGGSLAAANGGRARLPFRPRVLHALKHIES